MDDFREKRPFGQTGLLVSRLGIGSSFGAPARVIEEAVDQGVNYLYWGSIRRPGFGRAMRHLAARQREGLVLTVQSYSRVPALIGPSVDTALLRSRVGYFDFLLLGMRNDEPVEAYVEAFERLRQSGKVRFLALSTHNRPLLPKLFDKFRAGASPYDAFMFRYNAAHRGAETDALPFVPEDRRPGIIAYTATRWGHLLDPAKMPAGETAPRASDCYRFALGQPQVDLVLCGPANRAQMQEALVALDRGPLDPEELARMRRIGDHVYRNHKPQIGDKGDAKDTETGVAA
jgi:aryl-alcohol dehydrogenase-like predicted oxidoreductase